MKVLKFDEVSVYGLDKKIDLVKEVFQQLEDEGLYVYLRTDVSGAVGDLYNRHAEHKGVSRWPLGDLMVVSVRSATTKYLTDSDKSILKEFEEGSLQITPDYQWSHSDLSYHLYFFKK